MGKRRRCIVEGKGGKVAVCGKEIEMGIRRVCGREGKKKGNITEEGLGKERRRGIEGVKWLCWEIYIL